MSEHPCSKDNDRVPGVAATQEPSAPAPRELDKDDPSPWVGKTPGDVSHLLPDHPLKISRGDVKSRYEDSDSGEQ